MNQDQLTSLARTALKAVGTFLITHHLTKYGTWISGENGIGLATVLIGWFWSHQTHADKPSAPAPTSRVGLMLALALCLGLWLPACKSPPERQAFTAVQAPAVTGEQAIRIWGDYVSRMKVAGTPVPKSQELQVVSAYAKYRAIELAAIDSAHTAAIVMSSTNSLTQSLVDASQTQAAQDALAELVALIRMFGAKL